ncbi:hypothetical protein [Campylobacter pinnipediorum]|uniref:hypothetical protein n=1 Tax=Campylobacter pinnipediorum TaxID=1965231 RepID=UPI00112F9A97|nr:hypothetical protein [Campylobacter pinnipediorum]
MIILIIALFFIFNNKDENVLPEPTAEVYLKPLKCDLNNKKCDIVFEDKKLEFEINPKPILPMQPVIFSIKGLENFNYKNLSLEFYGLDMDMGIIKAKLKKDNDNTFSSKIVLSACVLDKMRYRFEILNNNEKTGIYIDFDIKM